MADETPDSLDVDRQIDAVCDDFEQALTAGQSPQIESHLIRVPSPQRQALLLELLGLELDFRVARGEQPAAGEYAARFPELQPEQLTGLLNAPRVRGIEPPASPEAGSPD